MWHHFVISPFTIRLEKEIEQLCKKKHIKPAETWCCVSLCVTLRVWVVRVVCGVPLCRTCYSWHHWNCNILRFLGFPYQSSIYFFAVCAFRIPERHQAITRFKLDKYTRARKTTARTCYLLRAMVANVLPETDWDWAKLKLNFRLYSQSHCHLATDKTGTGTGSIDWHIYFLCIGHKVGEGMRSVWFRFLHVFLVLKP